MESSNAKKQKRDRRHARIRATMSGTGERPRLAIFKSNRYIHAQVIDDEQAKTICSITTKGLTGTMGEQASAAGEAIAKKAKELKVTAVVFDRGGFPYSGKIRAFAEGARTGGLKF